MKAILTIDGFKTRFSFSPGLFKGDIDNGEQLLFYLQKFFKFSHKQQSALRFNRYKIEYI